MPPLRNLASHWYITERWKPSALTTFSGLSPPSITRWTARFLISARVAWESLRPSRLVMSHYTTNVYLFTLGFVSPDPPIHGERVGAQVRQIGVWRRGPEAAHSTN